MKNSHIWGLLTILVATTLFIGCGSASDDLTDFRNSNDSNDLVTFTNKVTANNSASVRLASRIRFATTLTDLSGITVFLEQNGAQLNGVLPALTDNRGVYTLFNVPQGNHTIVAQKSDGAGGFVFRARQENVPIVVPSDSNEKVVDYVESANDQYVMTMEPSNYSLDIVVTDNDGNPLTNGKNGLSVFLWGIDYAFNNPNSNTISLKDFPETIATATISATGFKTTVIPVEFGENYNSVKQIKLLKTTENINRAPIVSITYDTDTSTIDRDFNDILTINPNRYLYLTATGYDADGDSISYDWSATSGILNKISNNKATFIATQTYNQVIITLTGTDSKNAIGKAELKLSVSGGTIPIATGTTPVASDTPDIASGTETIGSDTSDIGSGTETIGSDTSDIGSGTAPIGSDTSDIGSGTTPIGSDTSDIGSGTTPIGSDTSDIGSGTTPIGSDTSDIGSGTAPIGSDTSDIGSGTAPIGSDTSDIGSGTAPIGSDTSDIGSGTETISGNDYSSLLENPGNWFDIRGASISLNDVYDISSIFSSLRTENAYFDEYNAETAINIDLTEKTISPAEAEEYVSFDEEDNTLTIEAAGTYVLSGTLNGQISIPEELTDGVTLVLNGATIISQTNAAIYNVNKVTPLKVLLISKTTNTLMDATSYIYDEGSENEPNACLFSNGDLIITGNGTLNVTANCTAENQESDGICCNGDNGMIITAGKINVSSDGASAINCQSSLVIDTSSPIVLSSKGNGILTQGDIYFKSSNLTITSDCGNAIISEQAVYFDQDATVDVTANGDGILAKEKLLVTGGNITVANNPNTKYDIELESSKGLVSDSIHICGGKIKISSNDCAIYSEGNIDISGNPALIISPSNQVLNNIDELEDGKGILGKGEVTIGASGTPIIRVISAENAIQSETNLTIAGGDIKVCSLEDGLNVGGEKSNSKAINISGGETYIYAKGNGVNSIGNIGITGGTLVINQDSNSNSTFNAEGSFSFSGETLIAAGNKGIGSDKTNSGSANFLKIHTNGLPKGKLINIQEDNGTSIITFAPTQNSEIIEFGTSLLTTGNTYNIYVGGNSTYTNINNGIFYGGAYSAGTLLGSVTIDNSTKTYTIEPKTSSSSSGTTQKKWF